ncbi:MAG: SRPBCC domain-containing protein [Anaerolineales bacterium]|nr:SRPBCC domain-containing protein [Anaerolineales bacterium]
MSPSEPLTFQRLVNAPAAEAFRAFTHATALRDWLCNAAQTDPRPNGRVYLWWDDGYAAAGVYTKFEPGRRLIFGWSSPQEPGPLTVDVRFREKKGGVEVSVTHAGLGSGGKWKVSRASLQAAWEAGLENLGSFLETGVDLRVARRPRLGIFIDEYSPVIAERLGVPAKQGVRISGTADGSGAQAASLQKDDVLIALNGRKLTGPQSFGSALQGLRAGDKPKLVFYRGAEKLSVPLELSSFPIPELPATGVELAGRVRQLQAEVDAAIAQAVDGLTEAQAERRPADKEWNAKQLIAHFILSERDYQAWVADMLNDNVVNDFLEFRPNVDARLDALVARLETTAALRLELTRAEAETAALLAALPASFIQNRKHLYRRAAQWALEVTAGHWHGEHAEQMQRTLAAARA